MSAAKKHLIASFKESHALLRAAETAKQEQCEVVNVYMPFPDHHVLEKLTNNKSPARFFTFFGAGLGLVSGLLLALLTTSQGEIIVSGKPVYSIVPFIIVGFELLILFGALATLAAVLLMGRLPFRRFPPAGYRVEFSDDQFGLWIACPAEKEESARQMLTSCGAKDINPVASHALIEKDARS